MTRGRFGGALAALVMAIVPSAAQADATTAGAASLSDRVFTIRGLGNRCLDVGGQAFWAEHAPVMIYGCNGTMAQKIRVRELDATTHDVELSVPGSPYCIGVAVPPGQALAVGQPLELHTCDGSAAQRFAVDGDAILVGTQAPGRPVAREDVIEPAADSTNPRARLVVGERDLSDAEYFRFRAVDGSDAAPTTGFVRVQTEAQLDAALARAWGTVVEVAAPSITLSQGAKVVREGVTLRGYRKHVDNGPEIVFPRLDGADVAFVLSDHARVTGLRLRGPSRAQDGSLRAISGIQISSALADPTDVIVDHVEASDWTSAAVNVVGPAAGPDPAACYPGSYPREPAVKIVGNFLHHNVGGLGYGVVAGNGAFPLVRGNVMYMNNHSIAADGNGATGYVAYDNLVTSGSVSAPASGHQDFDAHGTDHPGEWYGGTSGDVFDIGWNTFLSTAHPNYKQRGTPCHYTFFHDNVSVQSSSAVQTLSEPPTTLILAANRFVAPDPTSQLAVGDFDGDRIDDVFLSTGATWWFSSGGQAEWRLLNRMPESVRDLRFGDFDGDGRTDVLAIHGARLDVSWAGTSPWTLTAARGVTVADVAVADFDGDGRADIFAADGTEWTYASAGRTWTHLAWSTRRASQLRFGDFTTDGRADVLFVAANQWQIVRGGGTGASEPLRPALTPTVDGLVVADFDGDHFADVAAGIAGTWSYSSAGRGDFVGLRPASQGQDIAALPVGRFDGDARADVLVWSGRHLAIASGAREPVTTLSRQQMR
jgi:hypothetical protein